jgi:hypothetical protein
MSLDLVGPYRIPALLAYGHLELWQMVEISTCYACFGHADKMGIQYLSLNAWQVCPHMSLNALSDVTPVPIDTTHLTIPPSGSGPHASCAWSHTSRTGLFAPVAPSTNSSPYRPTAIGSKKEVADEVARHASHIVTLFSRSLLPRSER